MRWLPFLGLMQVCAALAHAQVGAPLFTSDFPPEEFAQRRARLYQAIGSGAIALLPGAPSPVGYVRFRQANDFYYLCGVETPHAYLLLDGSVQRAMLYLPHRNETRERSEGRILSAEDGELVQRLSGIDAVYGVELLAEHLARYVLRGVRVLYTPLDPAEGLATSRDIALRTIADWASDPWDGRPSREGHFVGLLRMRFPQLEIRNLSPILDSLRLIKSPRELELIRKATRLAMEAIREAMRSTQPGQYEYELEALAQFIFRRHGAQGDAYYALVASGPNAWYPHYHAGKRQMRVGELVLMDYAPDVGYYMSDVTRIWPVDGRFSPEQRELYTFYLACYRAILRAIRAGRTAQEIKQEAASEMERILAASRFSRPHYRRAAESFVASYKESAQNPHTTLGHWLGMATHDVGRYTGPLRPGMVFTIEPALRVPEESLYIRLEDVVIITESGVEIVSEALPMDVEAIERLMREEGILERYPRLEERMLRAPTTTGR
ncbi:MAG: Xaa-Pro peptidase family protein [Bacteroidetes bacterium]|nr:Xaa-Pro peptidase family protein [Rhodothermia bacterium]MCX7907623.1 Xaa-Pro peptidase family protein [Bacteroidota bacterium]MDW8286397.1 Xaa-Pro peptidase family protein [Bacteroidota bacterium]